MGEWWNSITGFEKVFYYFAVPFTLLFVIQLILTFIGIGDDSDVGGVDDDGFEDMDSSFHIFTVRNFITFFTVFGWTGITLINSGFSKGATIAISTVSGIIAMFIVAGLFYSMLRLSENGTVDLKNAIGLTGEVYIPIPENKSGIGKIQITIQDSLREVEAMTNEEQISTGTFVKVIGLVNNVLIVEKLN